MEKALPPPYSESPPLAVRQKRSKSQFVSSVLVPAILLFAIFKGFGYNLWSVASHAEHQGKPNHYGCGQPDALFPSNGDNEKLDDMWQHLSSDEFRDASISRLSGAVQIPTESFDDLGPVGEDPRWEVMYPFAKYLEHTFPRVHDEMAPEIVNTHGLIYTLEGSDADLKPIILMAHQDVVPVPNATVSAWTHPPFSGHYDGKYIWGRGSSDCKNNLIAIMEAMELFLEAGYKPKRTVILSFGFDEEISGRQGAGHLSSHLLERYGADGVAALVDEGAGFESVWGSVFAKPGTAEKGYTDVHITVRYPGGHSSIPTDHTSIGILSEVITKIEAERYLISLADNNPYLEQLQCGAEYSPKFPKSLKKLLRKRKSHSQGLDSDGLEFSGHHGHHGHHGRHGHHGHKCPATDRLAIEAAKLGGKPIQYLMETSQAVDVIQGGVKVNALPERVTVTVNHRINVGEKPEMVWDRLTKLTKPIAKKYKLKHNAFNGIEEEPMSISLWPSETTLNPAPVTPTDTDRVSPYAILAGTTRAVYGEHIIVAPGIMTGNTDTRYYWDITKHIFRYGAGYDPEDNQAGLGSIHTVDEHVSVAGHIGMVKFFTLFVRNMDEADLED